MRKGFKEYQWKVNSLTKKTIENFESTVTKVIWEKVGYTYDGHFGIFKTATVLDTNALVESNFINYEDLTQEIIVDWIKQHIDEDDINRRIQLEIEKSRDNEMEVGYKDLPWKQKS